MRISPRSQTRSHLRKRKTLHERPAPIPDRTRLKTIITDVVVLSRIELIVLIVFYRRCGIHGKTEKNIILVRIVSIRKCGLASVDGWTCVPDSEIQEF